ncbi:MAG: SDR family NAD(P)-dependent oxidoreductase [Promethearchaeota archaeon]|jgi:NAD(P)-dependent dehydrogenase (short-subunit alcohol dehydrogenase family)
MEENFLEGKGAVITGGASGFGRGAAYTLTEKGADIVLVDINEELLEETAKKVEQTTNRKVIPILCDVSKSDQVKAMAKQIFEELDNVYILFNNAGIADYSLRDITKVREEMWDKVMDINLKGQWLIANSLLKKMKRQTFEPLAGKIICTSSLGALQLSPILPTYCISKVGVIAMAKLFAKTLAPKITVNTILPGIHTTGIYLNSEEIIKQMMRMGNTRIPLGRIGTVEDVTNVLMFLASPASDYITGQTFIVSGG